MNKFLLPLAGLLAALPALSAQNNLTDRESQIVAAITETFPGSSEARNAKQELDDLGL